MTKNSSKVLAIGLDAGDRDFINDHLEDLPNIARFFENAPVHALEAEPMAGGVWSSFATRKKPGGHGVYHHIQWNPDQMGMQRTHPNWVGELTPFWRSMSKAGKQVCVLDVPFVFEGDSHGSLEILNWGSHDLVGPFWASDKNEEARIRSTYGIHPMGFEVPVDKSRKKLAEDRDDIIKGVELRTNLVTDLLERQSWDLFVFAFGETHRAGHMLYPNAEEDEGVPRDALLDVYKAVDQSIGKIISQVDQGCEIILFALHGMGPNSTQSHLTRAMLDRAMHEVFPDTENTTVKTGFIRFLRQNVPAKLQHAIATLVPTAVRDFVVAREIGGGISKGSTKAISLDGDLSGYWRLNIASREKGGLLSDEESKSLAQKLGKLISGFTTADGRALVKEIQFPAAQYPGERASLLPDILAVWDLDIEPLREAHHAELGVVQGRLATGRGGNHKFNGFFCHRGPRQGTRDDANPYK